MTDKKPEPLIRADELDDIGALSNTAREMASMTIRLLYKENEDLRAKLSEPKPEPVAYIDVETRNLSWAKLTRWETPTVVKMDKVPLYTAPPKKEWVGLTNEEIEDIRLEYHYADGAVKVGYERAIEAKLKEKNGG